MNQQMTNQTFAYLLGKHVRMISECEAVGLRGSGKAESIVHGVGYARHQTRKAWKPSKQTRNRRLTPAPDSSIAATILPRLRHPRA